MKARSWSRIAPLALSLALLPMLVFAGQVTVPNTFVNGNVADADQVNANFAAIATEVNDNDTRIDALEDPHVINVRATASATDSGNALIAALGAITTNSSTEPFVVRVGPGIYDLGTASLQTKASVKVKGAGRASTTIQGSGPTVVEMADGAELSCLTIEHDRTGVANTVNCVNAACRLEDVHVETSATDSSDGIEIQSSEVELFRVDVDVILLGGTLARGINLSGTLPRVGFKCGRVQASGGSSNNCGFEIIGGIALIEQVVVDSSSVGALINNSTTRWHECRIFAGQAINKSGGGTTDMAGCQLAGAIIGTVTTVHCYDGSFVAIP